MPPFIRSVFLTLTVVAWGLAGHLPAAEDAASPPEFSAEDLEHYEKQVRPILERRCWECHGREKPKGNLRLTSRTAILRGGDLGPAASLKQPAESLLLQAVRYEDGLEMPPSGKLPPAEVAVLVDWVRRGLPWSGTDTAEPEPTAEPAFDSALLDYWAYRPVVRAEPPAVKNRGWVRTPIDAFVLARLEAAGLSPVPAAERVALLRRATYDLTGLPPTPEEVHAFLNDQRPDAYERLIDRLLDSPHYGEKWGRHWLDLVRYAETHGYERDSTKPFAWRYRDYVIQAFNEDKPYDQFLLEQLAGDELDRVTPQSMIATGYYRLGIWDDEPADRALARYDILDGIVSTTGQVVLGMSIGCCRCHTHKRDPIPQHDYYRLLACFRDVTDMNRENLRRFATPDDLAAHERELEVKRQREADIYRQIYRLEQQFLVGLAKEGELPSGVGLGQDLTELSFRFYRDTWKELPDFDALKAEDTGPVAEQLINLAPASRPQAIGLVFQGQLQVPADGEYTFFLDATAGARLIIDGRRVLDLPQAGEHHVSETALLKSGLAPIRLEYFNTTAKPVLNLEWSGPDLPRRSLSQAQGASGTLLADSREAGRVWRYTTEKPAEDWSKPDFSAAGWQDGPGGFGVAGTPGAVVRTEWKSHDLWLRTEFDLKETPAAVGLNLHHDEDVEVYVNGAKVYEARGFLKEYETRVLPVAAVRHFQPGRNVLAVHCRQTGGGQYVDVGLYQPSGHDLLVGLLETQGKAILGERTVERYRQLVEQLENSRRQPPAVPGIEIMAVDERGQAKTHVLLRGNPGAEGDEVTAGVPIVFGDVALNPQPRDGSGLTSSGKRRALAEWLVRKDNPLTARVMVNRLWQHHFGRGIVPSTNDFGRLGDAPSHPELLDWLADEFMRGDWRIKRMHKLLMLSSVYRLSSQPQEAALARDGANHLLWRFNMRRLTAEEVRDTILAISGQLSLKAGGPSIYPPIPRAVLAGQSRPGDGWPVSSPAEASRRSVYVHVKRSLLVPILSQHDQADTDNSCPVRYTTTVPTQSLGMLNGEFTNEQARFFAERLQAEHPDDLSAQVRRGIELSTNRPAAADEVARDASFIRTLGENERLSPADALRYYCLLLLNANETIYLD